MGGGNRASVIPEKSRMIAGLIWIRTVYTGKKQ